jgi:integrase
MKGCRPLDKNESERLQRRLTGKYQARNTLMWVILVHTGFRITEVLSLTIADVWQYGQVVTALQVKRKAMKGQREGRTVPLHPNLRQYIREWVRQCLEGGQSVNSPLFASQKDPTKPIRRDTAQDIIKTAAQKAKLTGKIGTHSGRKTFAKKAYDFLKGNIFKVQTALGHRDPMSTVAYLECIKSEIDEAFLSD